MAAVAFIIPYPIVALPTNVGAPGAKLYFYSPGTTTLVPVYADSSLTTQLTNPVIADGAGRTEPIWLNGANTYKLVIKDKSGAVLYTQDPYTPGTLTGVVAVTASGTTSISGIVNAVGDGIADDTAAIQAAIDALALTGGLLYFAEGTYKHTGLTFKNKVQYRGAGRDTGSAKGTVLLYTGTGDGVQINNPINSSTSANISVEGITFKNQNVNAGKGCFADTGSTDLKIRQCTFAGSDRGLILDQSELVDVTECDFEGVASQTSLVWIVGGADRNFGASAGYSNRIKIASCQINGQSTTIGIVDDGGNAHSFPDNNYNGCLNHIRVAGVAGLSIYGGEFESASSHNIRFEFTSLAGGSVGQCSSVYVGGAAEIVPSAGNSPIFAVSVGSITLDTVYFGSTTAVKYAGTTNTDSIHARNCFNAGGGATFDGKSNKHFEVGTDGTTNAVRTNLPIQSTAAIGYATGAGAAVTQLTNKSTATPAINKPCGAITMHNAALAAGAKVSFVVTNNTVAATDTIIVSVASGGTANAYRAAVTAISAGTSFTITVENITAGSLSEAPVINFAVLKAVSS